MMLSTDSAILQEILWGHAIGGALWPFQPRGPDYLRPLHLHSQPELLVVRRGALRLRVGGETHSVERGQVAWIPPAVAHVVEDLTPQTDFWVLQPGPKLFEQALARAAGAPSTEPGAWRGRMSRVLPDPPVLRPAAAELGAFEAAAELAWSAYLHALRHPILDARFEWLPAWDEASAGQARRLLLELTVRALRMTLPAITTTKERLARRAFDLLLTDPMLTRDELCERLAVSEGHLSRRFHELFGATLVEQRARARLCAFVTAARTDRNLLQAGMNAGFGSYAQLHRVFTRHSGCGPREYLSGGADLQLAKVTRAAGAAVSSLSR